MSEEKNLIGNQYGLLTVVDTAEPDAKGNRRWLCRCECGNTVVVLEGNLVRLHTRSCGCLKSPDLTGRVFGKLTVLGRSEKRNPRGARTTPMWECRCECGNITYAPTSAATRSDNRSGYTGVSPKKGKWEVRICYQGVRYLLGSYDRIEEAVDVRRNAEALLKEDPEQFVKKYERYPHHRI